MKENTEQREISFLYRDEMTKFTIHADIGLVQYQIRLTISVQSEFERMFYVLFKNGLKKCTSNMRCQYGRVQSCISQSDVIIPLRRVSLLKQMRTSFED